MWQLIYSDVGIDFICNNLYLFVYDDDYRHLISQ
jgi:hypothetical protein